MSNDILIKRQELELERKRRELKDLSERNEIYEIARIFRGENIVLIGGSGSGKSYEIADLIEDRIVFETKEKTGQAHRILGVRAERTQVSESQFPLLQNRAFERYPDLPWDWNIAKGSEKIKIYGNEILFSGLDDVNKLKSIYDITGYWMEEADQTALADRNELERRLRTQGDLIRYLSFNPTSINSWLKTEFFDGRDDRTICLCGRQPFENFIPFWQFKISEKELNRKVIDIDKRTGKEIKRNYYHTLIIHSTYLDNKFLPDSYYVTMAKMQDKQPDEFKVYGLGGWGIMGGTYFDSANVNMRKRQVAEWLQSNSIKRGYFKYTIENYSIDDKSIEWVNDADGYIEIREEPKRNVPYVIGADTMSEGEDFDAAICVNNITEDDVAVIYNRMDEDLYAHQLYCLGKYYGLLNQCGGNALIAPEINHSTHPMKVLVMLDYDNIYNREGSPDEYSGRVPKKLGFKTTSATRPTMLEDLKTLVREEPEKIHSIILIDEMTTFVKSKDGRPEAMAGKHDDMIIARAIAKYARNQQPTIETIVITEDDLSNLHPSLQEDYYNASESEQKQMLERWRKNGAV